MRFVRDSYEIHHLLLLGEVLMEDLLSVLSTLPLQLNTVYATVKVS